MKSKNIFGLLLLLMFIFVGNVTSKANTNSVAEATQTINGMSIDSGIANFILETAIPNYFTLKSVSYPTGTNDNSFWMMTGFNKVGYKSSATDSCSQYYGHGYCTDFIERKTGKRQRGNAGQWSGNIPINQGQGGDVAIFSSPYPYGHVAYIVRPVYQHNTANLIAYDIEEWNWGSQWVNRACAVTSKFGITTSRRVPVSSVSRIWRP